MTLAADAAPAPGDAPPSWGDQLDAHLAASGITPPDWWGEGEAETSGQWEAERARLAADLAEHPTPTLTRMATLDPSGAVVGTAVTGSATEAAWRGGAPAALIAEADRLAAILDASGPRGSRRWMRTALRLAWWVRSLNRRLRPYNGLRRTFSTATHRDTVSLADRLALAADRNAANVVALDAARSTSSTPSTGPPGSTSPPILDPSTVTPMLRTGPPAALRRGHDRLMCARVPQLTYGGDREAA